MLEISTGSGCYVMTLREAWKLAFELVSTLVVHALTGKTDSL